LLFFLRNWGPVITGLVHEQHVHAWRLDVAAEVPQSACRDAPNFLLAY
jgi:hypothetical protein